ncbi:MAG: Unknown protein [uncultured Campylobacterales bacterium]|uniref:Uncharacterized protein n=1 Tax=uncultured Campylobacterales bacterium TaxID=352960 RepID=A0A6S6SCT1_9BACT|nr:MAG: Unknown protein [uncultured Campylobacterales bacterium]
MRLPKEIKFFNEYNCYPLWLNNIHEKCTFNVENEKWTLPNINPLWLPISKELKQEIEKWDDFYQNLFMNTPKVFKVKEMTLKEKQWFYKKGKELFERLKKELPNVKVYYHDMEYEKVVE